MDEVVALSEVESRVFAPYRPAVRERQAEANYDVDEANAERLRALLPNATVATLPGCGHMFWLQEETRSVQLINDFLGLADGDGLTEAT